jgi:EAL domain-containing protein (putative c-di-GMP-specific phosphodiesterase class I)
MSPGRIRRAVAGRVEDASDHVNNHFAVVGAVLLLLGVCGLVAVARMVVGGQLRSSKEHEATTIAAVLARAAFEPAIFADGDGLSPTEVARLDSAARGARASQTLLGLTVYAPDGRVLYSPSHGLIGTRDSLDAGERAALTGKVTTTRRPGPTEPTGTASGGSRIEVEVPLRGSSGGVVALFSVSLPYAPIESDVASNLRRLDLALLALGLTLLLMLGPRLRKVGGVLRSVSEQQHRALVRDLRRAIKEGQLRLEYQPLAHLRSGRVRAVEALVRWDHPQRGLVAPGAFIPQAVQTPVIWALTEHVLDQAIRQAAAWREQGLDLRVTVNVPGPCLLDHRLPTTLAKLLRSARLPADRIGIELTEESVIREPQAAVDALLGLRTIGIEQIALDDFGTGYSSLTRLRDLPITAIKIDRSFIIEAGIDGDSTLIAAMTDLAHKFGLVVVAEGIEDETSWDRVREIGCDIGQGYWLSRPLRAEAVPDWMDGRTVEAWPQTHGAVDDTAVPEPPDQPAPMPRSLAAGRALSVR